MAGQKRAAVWSPVASTTGGQGMNAPSGHSNGVNNGTNAGCFRLVCNGVVRVRLSHLRSRPSPPLKPAPPFATAGAPPGAAPSPRSRVLSRTAPGGMGSMGPRAWVMFLATAPGAWAGWLCYSGGELVAVKQTGVRCLKEATPEATWEAQSFSMSPARASHGAAVWGTWMCAMGGGGLPGLAPQHRPVLEE